MCENLLAEFFSSLFRDICMETYRLCPFSFAHWDIYMKTYSLCPFSFVYRDIYARKNAICPIATDLRDIMQRNDSICPTVPKKRDITEQKFSICPQDRLAYCRFLYVTVSSPLTCDWLRFSRMRISAISRCAVFEIPFSFKAMAFCLCPHCFWQHLFCAVHPPADVCCWQSLRRK